MDIIPQCEYVIEDLDTLISQKEEMKMRAVDPIIINQLQCEINELRTKRANYNEFYQDQMMKRCFNGCCNGGCCRSGYFTFG